MTGSELSSSTDLVSAEQKKDVLERLNALEIQRKADREARRAETATHQDPSENIDVFIAAFKARQQTGEDRLKQLQDAGPLPSGSLKGAIAALTKQLDDLSGEMSHQEEALAKASYFLPKFDQKQCTLRIMELRAQLETAKTQLLPKKKFGFASKVARVKVGTMPPETGTTEFTSASSTAPSSSPRAEGKTGLVTNASDRTLQCMQPSARDLSLIQAGRGKLGLRDQVVTLGSDELDGQEYVLYDLQGCTIHLMGQMQSLRMIGLSKCQIFSGPVTGSSFVDGAQDCVFVLASYQVRIHHALECSFYLRVRSRPIIEDTTGAAFAPYCWSGPHITVLLSKHQLGEETDCWGQVDDFGWIKAIQSPNWRVIPPEQRRGFDLEPVPALSKNCV